MSDKYAFSYDGNSVYTHVIDLVRDTASEGLVIDLGCGYGAVAEPLREFGFEYVGLDLEAAGVKNLQERGFEAYEIDLRDVRAVERRLLELLDDRAVAAFLLLDVAEHLTQPEELLSLLRRLSGRFDSVPLVVSIPNVAHYDVAAKLLIGRWDVTETGLLDRGHVTLFTQQRLQSMMRSCGWMQIAARDFELVSSDQRFPADFVAFMPRTPLHDLLRQLRMQAAPAGSVNQFVRAYLPCRKEASVAQDDGDRPFLTILTRTQGRRPEALQDLLLCLAGQSVDDFELLVLAHGVDTTRTEEIRQTIDEMPASFSERVTLVPVEWGGGRARPLNVGVKLARGSYVAMVDDDDVVLGNWVEEFRRLAQLYPGRLLRLPVATQEIEVCSWPDQALGFRAVTRTEMPYPATYDLLLHLTRNHTPLCGLAFPRSIFRDLGVRFDESLEVVEDWDAQLQAALLCGVGSAPEGTSIYRRWHSGEEDSKVAHHENVWRSAHIAVLAKLDRLPLILPVGSASRIRSLWDERGREQKKVRGLEQQLHTLEQQLHGLEQQLRRRDRELAKAHEETRAVERRVHRFETSTSWRVTKPLRAVGALRHRRKRRNRGD